MFSVLLPEIILAVTLAGLIGSEMSSSRERLRLTTVTAFFGLMAALIQTALLYPQVGQMFMGHAISLDPIAYFFKLLILFFGILVVFVTYFSNDVPSEKRSEINGFIVSSVLAFSLLVQSGDLILMYVCLQIYVLLCVFMVGISDDSFFSLESGKKLLVMMSIALGLFLFGSGLLFNFTGSLNLFEMQRLFENQVLTKQSSLLIFTLFFLAFAFLMGSFPMTFWMPDVLQGAPLPSSLFVGFGLPIAGLAIALRFLLIVFSVPTQDLGHWEVAWAFDWTVLLSFASGATALMGALLALRQTHFQRLLGCLVLSQVGFLMSGLSVLDRSGLSAFFYSCLVFAFSLVGTVALTSFFKDRIKGHRLADWVGGIARYRLESIFFFFFLASLFGLPPAPGFMSKFVLIDSAVRDERFILVGVLVFSFVLWMVSFGKWTFPIAQLKIQSHGITRSARAGDSFQRAFFLSLLIPMFLLVVFAEPVLVWMKSGLLRVFW